METDGKIFARTLLQLPWYRNKQTVKQIQNSCRNYVGRPSKGCLAGPISRLEITLSCCPFFSSAGITCNSNNLLQL